MKELWKNAAIIAKRNVDSNQNPISVNKTELKQVIDVHSCIVLDELPDESYGIEIDKFYEVYDIEELTEKSYKVDYANGVVYFHPFNTGKLISVDYAGIGYTLISASRITTKFDRNGNVLETLEGLIDKSELHFKAIESLGTAVDIIEKLGRDKDEASILHENIVDDIAVAKPLQEELRNDIDEAKTFKDKLSNDVVEGARLETSLGSLIVEGSEVNEDLELSVDKTKDIVDLIKGSGNEFKVITTSEWSLNSDSYCEYTWVHNLNSENVVLNFFDYDTKESLNCTYKHVDKNTIKILSDERRNVKVVIAAQYYSGGMGTVTDEVGEARGSENSLGSRLDKISTQVNTDKVNIQSISSQLADNEKQVNGILSSYDKNLIEVKQRLFDTDFKNRQYIFVGDSLREANGRWVFKKMAYKLAKCGISPCLIGKSGLKAEHWSKTNIVQSLNDFPTVDDVIKVIKGDGSECVIDICLCTNDLSKTEAEVIGYLKKGISDILLSKPNVKFILTTPNRYKNSTTNNEKAYRIIKTVVSDLGNIAFSDVQNNVFRDGEDITPYMLDDVHPNKLGQIKIGEYKIKELFDGSETVTHDINFQTITFTNTDNSKTIIRYAIDYTNSDGHSLYLKKDYQNKWLFGIIVNSNWVYSSELIGTEGFNVLMPRFNSNDSLYGIVEVENIEGLINNASSSSIVVSNSDGKICTKINAPLIQTTSTIYDFLKNIKFWDLKGTIDNTDVKAKDLHSVSLKVGFYKTSGEEPTEVFFKRMTENEFILNMSGNKAIIKQAYISKDGVYDLQPITWDTIRASGKLKIKGLSKLKEIVAIGEQIKIINAQHYSPIVEKSIIELLDY